jgi:hypothetical protein
MSGTKIYLDLEDTVIDTFLVPYEAVVINKDKIKGFLDQHVPFELGIFSYAMYNYRQLFHLEQALIKDIESALGYKVVLPIPTIEQDIIPLFRRHFSKFFFGTVNKFLRSVSKEAGFVEYVKLTGMIGTIILIDDSVQSKVIQYPDLQIILKNVHEL